MLGLSSSICGPLKRPGEQGSERRKGVPNPIKSVTIAARDSYLVGTTMFPATTETALARLIVAGATGVPQQFYRRFAQYAADKGFEVWTMDYRGVGLSKPPSLRGFKADFLDWGGLDLAAVVDHLTHRSDAPIVMVGHSFGGHALGLLPNANRIAGLVTFATGAGWHGWMPPLERIRVLLLWFVFGPIVVRCKGYLAWSAFGMGEDLPKELFYQWRHWCRLPHYFFDDPNMDYLKRQFSAIKIPILAINATDDRWAPPTSRDAFMKAYRNAFLESVTISPEDYGLSSIGHMGYFRAQATPIWEGVIDWLTKKVVQRSS